MPHGWMCAEPRPDSLDSNRRCTRLGEAGEFRLDSLSPGRYGLALTCDVVGAFAKSIGVTPLDVIEGATIQRDVSAVTDGCDLRPVVRVTSTFRGHYVAAFETSRFDECQADGAAAPQDDEPGTWVELSPSALESWIRLRDAAIRAGARDRYFVIWRGTREGPGRYGHLSVSTQQLTVDSILVLRAPRRGDCR